MFFNEEQKGVAFGGTPFASLTPAPPTIYFVLLCRTRFLRVPPPTRVRGWTRPPKATPFCYFCSNGTSLVYR